MTLAQNELILWYLGIVIIVALCLISNNVHPTKSRNRYHRQGKAWLIGFLWPLCLVLKIIEKKEELVISSGMKKKTAH